MSNELLAGFYPGVKVDSQHKSRKKPKKDEEQVDELEIYRQYEVPVDQMFMLCGCRAGICRCENK